MLGLWPGLSSVAVVQATRQDLGDLTGKVTTERHYFISSLKGCKPGDARSIGSAIRGHRGVETNCTGGWT